MAIETTTYALLHDYINAVSFGVTFCSQKRFCYTPPFFPILQLKFSSNNTSNCSFMTVNLKQLYLSLVQLLYANVAHGLK